MYIMLTSAVPKILDNERAFVVWKRVEECGSSLASFGIAVRPSSVVFRKIEWLRMHVHHHLNC
jgi:hypothetical protein